MRSPRKKRKMLRAGFARSKWSACVEYHAACGVMITVGKLRSG